MQIDTDQDLVLLLPSGRGQFDDKILALDQEIKFCQLHVDIVGHACAIGEKTVSALYMQVIPSMEVDTATPASVTNLQTVH